MAALFAVAPCTAGDWVAPCASAQAPQLAGEEAPQGRIEDAPVAAFQLSLLEVAAAAASAMPAVPHVKNRCQLQEDVVMALIAIRQPVRAEQCADQIVNGRRGVAYGAIARHCGERGFAKDAERLIAKAKAVLERAEVKQDQEWRQDAIRSAIAAALQSLGHKDAAMDIAKRVVDPESGKLESLQLEPIAAADIEEHFKVVDQAIQASNMDVLVTTLGICAQVFDRDYGDAKLRDACEAKIRSARKRIPIQFNIDLLIKLADAAVAHQDGKKALALLQEAQELVGSARWVAEDEVKTGARLAKAIAAAGDIEGATKQVRAAFGAYEASQKTIVDIWRAGCLRPVAEAWLRIGDAEKAKLFYDKALSEGVANPNSRPRAQDLVATCISMVANGYEPDAAMLQRIQAIGKGLGQPW
jgi:tetratricopeptide (TPR) repeat protein